jgi:hypothetical protein
MQALKVIATAGSLWLVPIILLALTLESDSSFTQHAIFFSKTAVVAYIIQQAEQTYHWLQPGEILDGIGMAETTPGLLVYAVCWLHVRILKSYRAESKGSRRGGFNPCALGDIRALFLMGISYGYFWVRLTSRRCAANAL